MLLFLDFSEGLEVPEGSPLVETTSDLLTLKERSNNPLHTSG